MSDQPDLLPVEHVSLQPRRLVNDPERIYAEEWRKRTDRDGLLDHVLAPDCDVLRARVSRRDAQVAASVIQWLGTPVGLGFIRTCEDRIRRAQDRSDALERESWRAEIDDAQTGRTHRPEVLLAEQLAAPALALGPQKHLRLIRRIAAALRRVAADGLEMTVGTLPRPARGILLRDR